MADLTPDLGLHHWLMEGLLAVRAGDARRAVDDHFSKIIVIYEGRYRAVQGRFYCARTAEEATRYMQQALAQGQKARVVEAGLSMAYYHKGRELLTLDDVAGAEASLERARVLSPANAPILVEMGAIYKAEHKMPQALEAYQAATAALDLAPMEERGRESRDAYDGLGGLYMAMDRLDEAEAAYRQALAAVPDDELAAMELIYIQQQLRTQPQPPVR
ncbi:MAG: tetratricopeptide repeat protein [Azospirillaceae bacterium]|nr:tetratricopeptide repeat protein [Azospirillaceae bacterium]